MGTIRFILGAAALLALAGRAGTAEAGTVLDRVKAQGVVQCGSAARPGLARQDGKGNWSGLHVDLCRAVAAAVLGTPDRFRFAAYETPKEYDAVRNGTADVFFLTASEIREQDLAGKIVPGPTVFIESHAVMVPPNAPVHHLKDLAGKGICFMSASNVQRSLEAAFAAMHRDFLRMGYSEDGEMVDAYHVGRCQGLAYEVTTLASLKARGDGSRILPEPLSVFPVMAATGTADAQWSAIVAWTVDTLVSAERPETRWYAGGAGALPVSAPELGLDRGWQKRVLAAVGDDGEIFDRNLGKNSPLRLERGYNANQIGGGLMLSPFLE